MIVLQFDERDVSLIVNLLQYAQTAGESPAQFLLMEAEIKRQIEAQRSGQFVQCALCHDAEKPSKNFG